MSTKNRKHTSFGTELVAYLKEHGACAEAKKYAYCPNEQAALLKALKAGHIDANAFLIAVMGAKWVNEVERITESDFDRACAIVLVNNYSGAKSLRAICETAGLLEF